MREELVKALILKQFISSTMEDTVAVLYVKNLNTELAESLKDLSDWVDRKSDIQKLYIEAAETVQQPLEGDFQDFEDAAIKNFLDRLSSNLQIRNAPEGWPEFQIFSARELQLIARDAMINSFIKANNISEYMAGVGVSSDYRPNIDQMEFAILISHMVLAALKTEKTRPQIITPGNLGLR